MKQRKLTEADVTAESVFMMERRKVLKALGIGATALSLSPLAQADLLDWFKGNDRPKPPPGKPLDFTKPAEWQNSLALTPEDKVTGYNNFYEFGLDKADPAANAGGMKTDPWTLKIGGEVAKPLTLDHDMLTSRWKSVFTGCAAWKPGRWSFRGLAFRCINCSLWWSPPAMRNMWHSKPYIHRKRCRARKTALLAVACNTLTLKGCALMKPCIH